MRNILWTTLLCAAAGAALFGTSARAADPDELALERAYHAATRTLEDRSFYEKWKDAETFRDLGEAEAVSEAARAKLHEIESAMKDVEAYCSEKFFVNHCISEGRDKSYERRREINRIVVKVNDYRHAANVERMKERRNTRKPSEPMNIEPAKVREPSKPVKVTPKTPRAPSEPVQLDDNRRKPSEPVSFGTPDRKASEPVSISSDRAEEVAKRRAEAEERRAQEEANLAAYEEKQARAKEREAKAAELAEKRREKRLEKNREFQETVEERRKAQERYEERRTNQDSGLQGYF